MDRIAANIPGKKHVKPVESPELRFWKKYKIHQSAVEFSAITDVEFSPFVPYDLLVTSSTRVQLYEGHPSTEVRSVGRFKDVAYSGTFRPDGKLIAAGSATGGIHIIDAQRKSMLRLLKGHVAATRCVRFSSDNGFIFSGSNDSTVRYWDIGTETEIGNKTGHMDHIRCGQASGTTPSVFVSGSYDHTVKIWDWRDSSRGAIMTMDHGAPVESLVIAPTGTVIYTAGSNYVCVWDVMAGGRKVHKFTHHQKTVTCLRLDPARSLLYSGSLDQTIVAHDPQQTSIAGLLELPHPVLSFDLSLDTKSLAVGMSTGNLQIYAKPTETTRPHKDAGKSSHEFFLRGKGAKPTIITPTASVGRKITTYENYLRKFLFKEALDAALMGGDADAILSLVDELNSRKALDVALSGRNEKTLIPLLKFLKRVIANPQYSHQAIFLCNSIIDVYADVVGLSPAVDLMVKDIMKVVRAEIFEKDNLYGILGIMDALMASAAEAKVPLPDSFV
eukprot:TRINITY_DN9223_c0_g1_i1.p1 TRINITY_DN9223_c0_g1~~TRINITY_DN9223_c0_g1_i1.p1  ORF type:complete len:501 (+),score=96.66 TRINITY_DN9223_c0_g1_i1:46-1548(+)